MEVKKMSTPDLVFLGIMLVSLLLGAILGFGKVFGVLVLNKFTRIVLAIFVCYSFGGMILGIPFINQLLIDLSAYWADIELLNTIHLEIIIYYVALFLITILLLLIFSRIVKGISEVDVLPVKVLNKVAGAIVLAAGMLLLMLVVFQIIYMIGGATAESFAEKLSQSTIMLPLFENNPLLKIMEMV